MNQSFSLQTHSAFNRADSESQLAAIGLHWDQNAAVIICTNCKYALQPRGERVSRHLGERHGVPVQARAGLTAFLAELALPDPNHIDLLPDWTAPHPHLAVQTGASCKRCYFRSTSLELVKRHVSKSHRRTGRLKDWSREYIHCGAKLQSWTQNGPRTYWIVRGEDGAIDAIENSSVSQRRKVEEICREEEDRLNEDFHNRSTTDVGSDNPALCSNWMRRTGWLVTYRGVDRLMALQLRAPAVTNGRTLYLGSSGSREFHSPVEDERCLALIHEAVNHFTDRCEDTVRHTEHSIRCWLRSQIPGRPYKAPFEVPAQRSTRTRYRACMRAAIFFCLRASRLDESDCLELLHMRFSARQRRAIAILWNAVLAEAATQEGTRGQRPCAAPGGMVDNNDTHFFQRTWPFRSLNRRESPMLPFSMTERRTLAGEPTSDEDTDAEDVDTTDEIDCISDHDGSRLNDSSAGDTRQDCRPVNRYGRRSHKDQNRDASSTISATDSVLADAVGEFFCFLCSEEFEESISSSTLLVYFCGTLGFSPDGLGFETARKFTPKLSAMIYCIRLSVLERTLPRFDHLSATWPCRPRYGHLEHLNPIRELFLCNSCQAPMGELLSLRSFGRAASRADGPSFRVSWSDDAKIVSWYDGQIDMGQFRSLGEVVLQSIRASVARLMYGVRPEIRLEGLRDHWSNKTPGYSFVQDSANDLASAYLALSSRACLDPVGGLLIGDRWDLDAVRRYLKDEQELLLDILLLLFLRGGQSPRIPELTSLECSNGPYTSRGIYIHGGLAAYVTRHWKARKSTNQEFNVARYLPRADSALIVYYLTYIRPFADMLSRRCCGRQRERRLLFASCEHPEQPWKVEMVTKALKKLTKKVCGTAFGVRIYRQVSIAITERHVKQISRPFDRYDDTSSKADIDVAFAWQSGHRPIQRGTSYGIDSAYPDSLQPALLRIYRWASEEWHRFLQCASPHQREKNQGATKRQMLAEEASDEDPNSPKRQCRGQNVDGFRSSCSHRSPVGSRREAEDQETTNEGHHGWGSDEAITHDAAQRLCSPELTTMSKSHIDSDPKLMEAFLVSAGAHQRSRSVSTPDPLYDEYVESGDWSQSDLDASVTDTSTRSANNEDLNRLLRLTGRLCMAEQYRALSGTPTRPIQSTYIHYCAVLQILFCFDCGRYVHPATSARHLKTQHHGAYGQLDQRAVARLQQEISRLVVRSAKDIPAVSHDTYYIPSLQTTFNNFKCEACDFVDVNRKNVRSHFLSRHKPLTKSANRKVAHVIENVPLQTLEGFRNNRKVHFIPKLPDKLRMLANRQEERSVTGCTPTSGYT